MKLFSPAALLLGGLALAKGEPVRVQVNANVQITGKRVHAYDTEIEKFTGIRFATTPTLFGPAIPVSYEDAEKGTVIDGTLPGAVCGAVPPVTLSNKLNSFLDLLYVTDSPTDPLDCLNLDVHRPARADYTESMGVVVFVHGGGFKRKTRNQQHNQPEAIYRFDQSTIWVSVSYSLGPQAFWYTDENSNNRAIHEILFSLLWVQKNIAAFGGDPENVTIIGSMSGATLVENAMFYLREYQKFGFRYEPFSKVVLMSALAEYYCPLPIEAALRRQHEFLSKFPNCAADWENCLATMTKEEYLRVAQSTVQYQSPVRDGINLVGDSKVHYDHGLFMRPKSVLLTVAADEASLFILEHMQNIENDPAYALKLFGYGHLQELVLKDLGHLPQVDRVVRWLTDVYSIIPFEEFARRLEQWTIPVYRHEFHIAMPRLADKEFIDALEPQGYKSARLLGALGSFNTIETLMFFDSPISSDPPRRMECLADREFQKSVYVPLWSFIQTGVAKNTVPFREPCEAAQQMDLERFLVVCYKKNNYSA